MRYTARAVLALLVVLVLQGCGGGGSSTTADATPKPTPLIVSGRMSVKPEIGELIRSLKGYNQYVTPANATVRCSSDSGYDDIRPGAQVTVRDADGKTVGLGRLGRGYLYFQPGKPLISADCEFKFSVKGVPDGSAFYSIEVAHRGQVNFKRKLVAAGPVTLSLG